MESDENRMDFQPTENVTSTQAIGDENDDRTYDIPRLASPLSADHAAVRADFEIITVAAFEHLYNRITNDINKTTALAVEKATGPLHIRIATMSACIAQLQQQVLTYHDDVQRFSLIPIVAPASGKKDGKQKKEKQPADRANTNTNGNTSPTYAAIATAA
jgi:hypothetical protein